MRILLAYDGSESSSINLSVACSELQRAMKEGANHALHVVIFEFSPDQPTEPLILQAQTILASFNLCGVSMGEVIACQPSEITTLFAQCATQWQSDAIYLPLKGADSLAFNRFKLLELAGCPVILTAQNQTLMKVSYVKPKPAKVAKKPAETWLTLPNMFPTVDKTDLAEASPHIVFNHN